MKCAQTLVLYSSNYCKHLIKNTTNNFIVMFLLLFHVLSFLTGPALFRFTSEPKSAHLSPGGSTTLSCVATGRDDIKYSWYRRKDQFDVLSLSLINVETKKVIAEQQNAKTYTVSYNDVSDWKLYQCSAHCGGDLIFSDTARIILEPSYGT